MTPTLLIAPALRQIRDRARLGLLPHFSAPLPGFACLPGFAPAGPVSEPQPEPQSDQPPRGRHGA